jgi:alkanesulfonate monooxygenase SsuD/methylene tetrahydromethanopterin reductase-like flavin-dependent oxidoreductase (luciferase family)
MNYGVVLPIWQLTVAEAASLTVRAEELGLDGVFVPDHILAKPATTQHYGGHWPDPFSLLAYLAGRTRRIRLGASVIVLPYRNALVAAKAAATVDQASGGRFIFGVGVGWDEAEFVDLRLPFRERGRLSDDYLRVNGELLFEDRLQVDVTDDPEPLPLQFACNDFQGAVEIRSELY